MKNLIDIKPQSAKIKFENNSLRSATNVDRFCFEIEDGANSTRQQCFIMDSDQTKLSPANDLNPKDFENEKFDQITVFGDLFECACSIYNRLDADNMRVHYENEIINWCQINGKNRVTLLSIGSGGLLQEAILAEKLKSLGITPSFICVDHCYPSDENLEKIRQRKLREKVESNDFFEWMLTPSKPIMIYRLRCIQAMAAFKRHANLQTFCCIGDLALALEQKMVLVPDLIIAIDILAVFHTPIDTRITDKTTIKCVLQGYIGDKKYPFKYAGGKHGINRDWGWYNFTAMLLSSGLLKYSTNIPSIVCAYGMVKSFKGIDEDICYIPQENGSINKLGLHDSEPEVFVISPIFAELMQKRQIFFHCFPHRRIIVSPHMMGRTNFPEYENFFLTIIVRGKTEFTEVQYLLMLKNIFASALSRVEATHSWCPSFAQFKSRAQLAYQTSDYKKVVMATAGAGVCLAIGYKYCAE